jgi:hypothetical protein
MDAMEQTLTVTSKLIAGCLRTATVNADDPFSWMQTFCSEPSNDQPEVMFVHHPASPVPVDDTKSERERFDDLLLPPGLDASSASSGALSIQDSIHGSTFITGTNNKPKYHFDFSNEDITTGTVTNKKRGIIHSTRKLYESNDDNQSSRTQRTDYTETSCGTDLQTIHSFLMVSHAAPKTQSLSYVKQHQLVPYGHSHHSRVSTTSIEQNGHTPRYTPPLSVPMSPPDEDPDDCYILTPSWMRQLQRSFPMLKRGDSFWLQYSLIRDGASLETLLKKSATIQHCVLAIETVEGEVLGAFLAQPLQRLQQWSGSAESFLWRVCGEENRDENVAKARNTSSNGRIDYHNDDCRTKIDVFKFSFLNPYVQLCQTDRLLVGSGDDGVNEDVGGVDQHHDLHHGFGIALEEDLWIGTSQPCRTFSSPSLSRIHSDGSFFQVRNVEVWNLKPCLSMVEGNGQRVVHRRKSTRHRRL